MHNISHDIKLLMHNYTYLECLTLYVYVLELLKHYSEHIKDHLLYDGVAHFSNI